MNDFLMICLRKKMNKFFRKSKSPSPSLPENPPKTETPEQDSPNKIQVDDSSLSEYSHISSCTASDDSKDLSANIQATLEIPVTKSRSLSFDGMIRTLNQLGGSKETYLKVPENERSCVDFGKVSLSSQTNSTSQSTSNLTLMSLPGQTASPKVTDANIKCIHCMYLHSLAGADNFTVAGELCGQTVVPPVQPKSHRQRQSLSSNSSCSALTGSDLSDFSENESSDNCSTGSNFQRVDPQENIQGMERLSPPIYVSVAESLPLTPMIIKEGVSGPSHTGPTNNNFSDNSYLPKTRDEICIEANYADSERGSTCSNFSLSSSCDPLENRISDWKEAVTLQVPLFKPRSSSLDVQYNIELHSDNGDNSDDRRLSCEQLIVDGDPYKQHRSTSVDVNLPTEGSADYKAILVSHESNKKAIASQHSSNYLHPRHAEFGFKKREPRSTVDWSESANNGDHIWVDTNASGDSCYLGESECVRSGVRKKCVSCKIVAHTLCISRLDQMLFRCKPTFCEGSHRNYRENTVTRHHWVHRRRQDGKCSKCGKSFQQRFSFQSKEIIAIGCTWCKVAYHNKAVCFPMSCLEEKCTLGEHSRAIIPPSWVIKLPRKGYFKSSVCRKKKIPLKKRDSKDDQFKSFIVKPIPSPNLKPLLVFINPKSGGNQGTKIMHKFFWYLNPRQVFDLTQTKPQVALELYHKVMNLRILTCGGDGTVGWILSVIDHLSMNPAPPVAILPLGTGNDMARTLNWGGGYTDETVGKILTSVEESVVVQVDRWNLSVESLPSYEDVSGIVGGNVDEIGVANLPINVMNNYFSIGADANVTLEFHESREAKPEKFNSRFRNKMFYAGVGGIDILKRSWKDLTEYIRVECDGQNFDSVVRQSKFHCLLFLNIPKYAAGTNPWGNSSSGNFRPQRPDDGFLEVVGFTAASLASLQMGAHSGVRVTQCRHARLTTYKPMPVQVDGEPCRLVPSVINIERRNQANMLQKPKLRGSTLLLNSGSQPSDQGTPMVMVRLITMGDYESLNHDKEKLNKASVCITMVEVDNNCDLSVVRKLISSKLSRTFPNGVSRIPGISGHWSFIDTLTADQYFRIPKSKEHQHYISDVTSADIFILDPLNPLVLYVEPDGDDEVTIGSRVMTMSEDDVRESMVPVVQTNSPNMMSNFSGDEQKSSQSSDTEEMRIQSEKDYAGSVFLLACKSGDLNTIINLKNLADFSAMDSITGMTGLHYSAMHGHTPVIQYLIQEVSPVILDFVELGKSQTALHKAAYIVNRKICIHLLIAGSRCTLRDNEGFLPSMLALQSNDVELSMFLKKVEKAEFRDFGANECLSPDCESEPDNDQETDPPDL